MAAAALGKTSWHLKQIPLAIKALLDKTAQKKASASFYFADQQYWFVQIAQALGMMLSGGMLLLQSLRAVQQIYGRKYW